MNLLEKFKPLANSNGTLSRCSITNLQQYKKYGIKVLENTSENEIVEMFETANNAFHCKGKPLISDNEYDILHDYIERKYPKMTILKEIGAPVEKHKANLPYEMASMDKIKPDTGVLERWKQKYTGPYVISCKLDGVSGLYTTEESQPKLYTRGDGKIGQDISYLIPYLKLPREPGIVIRGEIIIKRNTFENKYKTQFANPRNLVAGIANSKSVDEKIHDVDFVAYELIKPEKLKPSQQMLKLEGFGFDKSNLIVVQNQTLDKITNESLSEILQDWRKNSIYEIDGIIISNDKVHPRSIGNPEHSFAFKMVLSDQFAEAHVLDVEWSPSKDGYLKPRVRINPIKLGGVTIQYATGFNGEFIEKNKIGIGAVIQIIRSGDVIPYIKSVTTPAENPKMPEVSYKWNNNHVDILLENPEEDIIVKEKQISAFFKRIEVDGLGPGNVKKIISAGYDTIPKILRMTETNFMNIPGFQEKTTKKLYEGIQIKIDNVSLPVLMAASNQFGRGFGLTKIELIMKEYPTILKPGERNLLKLSEIEGVGNKTGKEFIDRIPAFFEFIKECGLEEKLVKKVDISHKVSSELINEHISHHLCNKIIVMTGFRDKILEDWLISVGAKVGNSLNKNTHVLLVKNHNFDTTTGKIKDAQKYGVPIMTLDEFKNKNSL
jgi:NAD-dependent DNA ligase